MGAEHAVTGTEGGSYEEEEGDGDRPEGGDVPAEVEDIEGKSAGDEAGKEEGEDGLGETSEPRESERLGEGGGGDGAMIVPSRSVDDVGLPLNRIKRIMKVDPDIKKVSTEAFKLVSAATGKVPPGT